MIKLNRIYYYINKNYLEWWYKYDDKMIKTMLLNKIHNIISWCLQRIGMNIYFQIELIKYFLPYARLQFFLNVSLTPLEE